MVNELKPCPAYPCEEKNDDGSHYTCHFGMSKRELIAMAALQGMLSHPTRYRPRKEAPENWHEAISSEAFEIADAMMRTSEGTS